MISNSTCEHNVLKTSLGLIVFMSVWILCLTSNEASTVCSLDNKGDNCSSECNVTCIPSACNNETEECEECDDGFYGSNCTLECPANCAGQICDYVTGHCTIGCIAGYQGNQCITVCSKGYFGEGCESECPTNCASNECHHESGYCLNGCKDEFWGSDCTLNGEFKDNPEPAQHKFYSQLSAESKSILLYVLMGKYEETLQRAQMEINKGIQQRNELRALMGGDM